MKVKLFYSLVVLLVMVLFATGCEGNISNDLDIEKIQNKEQPEQIDQEKFFKEQFEQDMIWENETFYVTQEELRRFIEKRFGESPTTKIIDVESFSIVFDPGFVTRSGVPKTSEIWFHKFILETDTSVMTNGKIPTQKGYSITCGDWRITPMFAYVPIGTMSNTFMSGIHAQIERTINEYNDYYEYWTSFNWGRGNFFD